MESQIRKILERGVGDATQQIVLRKLPRFYDQCNFLIVFNRNGKGSDADEFWGMVAIAKHRSGCYKMNRELNLIQTPISNCFKDAAKSNSSDPYKRIARVFVSIKISKWLSGF